MAMFSAIMEYNQGIKPKAKLSQKMVREIEAILDQYDGPELYQFLLDHEKEYGATFKQAIAEWLRITNEIK